MKILFLILMFISTSAWAGQVMNPWTGKLDIIPTVTEEDGTPRLETCRTYKFGNGTVTDNGDSSCSIASGGGGSTPGGSGTEIQYRGGAATFSAVTGSGVVGGSIGIGLTTPSQALDVVGTIRTTNLDVEGTAYLKGNVGVGTGNPSSLFEVNRDTNSTGEILRASVIGLPQMVVIYDTATGTNVGINTILPQSKLQVDHNVNETVSIQGWGVIDLKLLDLKYDATSSMMHLNTNNSGRAIILQDVSGGNVGVNSIAPAAKLDVNGSVKMTNAWISGIAGTVSCLQSGSDGVITRTGTACGAGGGSSQWTTASNDIYFPAAMGTPGNVGVGTDLPLQKMDVLGTIRTTNLDVEGTAYLKGNVGIGSGVPGAKLEVAGTGNLTGITVRETANSGSRGAYLDLVNANNGNADPGGTIRAYANNTTNIASVGFLTGSTGATGNVIFSTNTGTGNVERMRVFQNGNVGINSATPAAKLDMQGTALIYGNVGIGSTIPGATLHVVGGVGGVDIARVERSSGALGYMGFNVSGSDSQMYFNANAGGSVWSMGTDVETDTFMITDGTTIDLGAADRFVINSQGNVGISSVFPTQKIDVLGTIKIYGSGSGLDVAGTAHFTGNVGIGTAPTAPLIVVGSGVGNVGIGSASPAAGLDVVGSIRVVNAAPSSIALDVEGTAYIKNTLEVYGTASVRPGTVATTTRVKIGGTLYTNTTSTSNSGAGETDLYSQSIEADTLARDGGTLYFYYAGTIATSLNNKQLRVKFGATTCFDSGAQNPAVASTYVIQGRIMRTGAATQKCSVELSTTGGNLYTFTGYSTAAETLSGAVILKVTGQGGASTEITNEMGRIHWEPAP